jgi:hypothetical protein
VSKHQAALGSIERQLRVHDLRASRLRAWLTAVEEALCRRAADDEPRGKSMDGRPDIRTLEYERDTLDREIRAHDMLTALGRDRNALELLDQVASDPSLAREAAPDPRAFASARGVHLPRNMNVHVKVAGGRVSVQVDFVDRACAASLTFP